MVIPQETKIIFPWEGNHLEVDGGTMHYLDEGPKDAPVILAVHGNPTWSFYWRALISAFSEEYRVVVPDHIGCGLSDKPQDWPYRLADHISNLEKLVAHLDLQNIILVVHDWGGAIGMGFATENAERISALVITIDTRVIRNETQGMGLLICCVV